MRSLLSLSLVALLSCTPAPVPRAAVAEGVATMQASLDQAVQAQSEGHIEHAHTAWRQANVTWSETVEPGLLPHLSHSKVLGLEFRLALVRHALDTDDGAPVEAVKGLSAELDEALRKLP